MKDPGEPKSGPHPPVAPALRDLVAEDRRALGDDHPDIEEWMAFRAGHLEAGRAEILRDHLSVCRECADLVLDLGAFTASTPPEGTAPVSDAQVKAALWQIQAALGGEAPPASEDSRAAESGPEPIEEIEEIEEIAERRPAAGVRDNAYRARRPSWRMSAGLIAASLLMVAGLTSWNLLRPGAPALQANAPLTDETRQLAAHDESPKPPGTRRGSGGPRPGDGEPLPADEEHSVGLPLPWGHTFEGYYLEVTDADNDIVFETGDLELQSGMDEGSGTGFTLRLPRGLQEGRYTVRVYGVEGEAREPIASYRFEITP